MNIWPINATSTAEPRRPLITAASLLGAVCLTAATVAGCGASSRTPSGNDVSTDAVAALGAELDEEGRAAYYFGPEAAGLPLTHIERVTQNGPDFQFFAAYGTCRSGPGEEGGCMDPLSVDTTDWHPELSGVSCQRLEPQLGVPAGLIMGELTLFTDRLTVRVVHAEDRADYDGHRGLALLPSLRQVGATSPVGTLPPPSPEFAQWVDRLCGAVPGETVEHPIEEEPGVGPTSSTSPGPAPPPSSPSAD